MFKNAFKPNKNQVYLYFLRRSILRKANYLLTLQPTRIARKGDRVGILLEKDVYERYLLRENLANSKHQKIPQPKRPHWVYCTLFALLQQFQYITTWAISSCLS